MSVVISPSCSTTSREQPLALARRQLPVAREHLDVRAQARQRRAQLVRGVRDELPLRGARRLLERREHRVEAAREAARARPARRPRSARRGLRVSVTVSVASVSRRTGASAARETTRPRPPRCRCRRSRSGSGASVIRARAWSTSSSGRATWTAQPGRYGKVSMRTWVPPTSRRRSTRRCSPRGDAQVVLGHRERARVSPLGGHGCRPSARPGRITPAEGARAADGAARRRRSARAVLDRAASLLRSDVVDLAQQLVLRRRSRRRPRRRPRPARPPPRRPGPAGRGSS